MELVLTGRRIDAQEALRLRPGQPGGEEEGVARQGASSWRRSSRAARRSPPRLAKQAVLAAEETALTAGLDHERRLFEIAMATEDRVEGMTAFIEKRRPDFKGR